MLISAIIFSLSIVALRKESVDRNEPIGEITLDGLVALRKESVDRNASCATDYKQ